MGDHAPRRRATNIQDGLPTAVGPWDCPVKGCRGRAEIWTTMRVNFPHQHVRNTVIILKEGNLPHPWCPRRDMMVTWKDTNRRHVTTTQCDKGTEQKGWRFTEEDMRKSAERSFQANVRPTSGLSQRLPCSNT